MSDLEINPHLMMRFDWEEVEGKKVLAVVGDAERSSIAFLIERKAIVLSVNDDTDELIVELEAQNLLDRPAWIPIRPLSFAVGLELGWCWIGRNYRGYLDTFVLAFGDVDHPNWLTPRCMFVGEASQLTIMIIKEAH